MQLLESFGLAHRRRRTRHPKVWFKSAAFPDMKGSPGAEVASESPQLVPSAMAQRSEDRTGNSFLPRLPVHFNNKKWTKLPEKGDGA